MRHSSKFRPSNLRRHQRLRGVEPRVVAVSIIVYGTVTAQGSPFHPT